MTQLTPVPNNVDGVFNTGVHGPLSSGVYYTSVTYGANFMLGVLPSGLTFTRSGNTANQFNSSGLLIPAAANVPRFDYGFPSSTALQGLLVEQASTNLALQCRDLTQAVWAATTMTTALATVGIDGVSNSATVLTATAGNATILQTVTQAATAATYSVFLKRISGSGAVNITQNGGTTWSSALLLSGVWQRFLVEASTLNPVFGIRVVTNGDVIAVDYNQFEIVTSSTTGATSPILTTTVPVTRNEDVLKGLTFPWYNANFGAFTLEVIPQVGGFGSNSPNFVSLNDGTSNNRITMRRANPGAGLGLRAVSGGVSQSAGTTEGTIVFGNINKFGFSYGNNNQIHAVNGVITTASGTFTPPSGINAINFTTEPLSSGDSNCWFRSFNYYNSSLNQTQLQSFTTLASPASFVGYNDNTFSSTFNNDIDIKETYTSGFKWYVWNLFSTNANPANIVPMSGGGVTLAGDTTGPNGQIVSAAQLPGNNFVGTAFGGGFYAEAVLHFDPAQVNSGTQGWPSWWSLVSEVSLTNTGQWPGQTAGYVHGVEADFMEYERPVQNTSYGVAMHDDYGVPGVTCSPGLCHVDSNVSMTLAPAPTFTNDHKYGFLWVPATATTNGYAKFFFDNLQVGTTITWNQYTNQSPTPSGQPWLFGVLDQQHLFLILGTGPSQPMVVQSVNVWQASSANNIVR